MIGSGAGVRIYTVVEVMRGVAIDAHSFSRLKDARACMRRLREGRDMQEDDVRLFGSTIEVSMGLGRSA